MNCEERADIIPQFVDFHQWPRVRGFIRDLPDLQTFSKRKKFLETFFSRLFSGKRPMSALKDWHEPVPVVYT